MYRRLSLPIALIAILVFSGIAYADPVDGCYASASAATIKEDQPVTITIQCDNVLTDNNVFGFQISAAPSGDYDVAAAPAGFTACTFSEASTGMLTEVLVGKNALSGLYAVSRVGDELVSSEDFTLGSYIINADDDLTVNGSIAITMADGSFIISNQDGASLSGWLRTINDVNITVTDIDLAWLTGNTVVRSDVTAISNVDTITLAIGGKTYTALDVANYTNTFTIDSTYQYEESGTPASDGTLTVTLTVDMTGHQACSNTVNLGDTGANTDVDAKVGTSGVVTLKAGDANNDAAIDNDDATLIGANFSTNPNDNKDINGDNTINILDLVHVGRNFGATAGACS